MKIQSAKLDFFLVLPYKKTVEWNEECNESFESRCIALLIQFSNTTCARVYAYSLMA